MDNELLQMAALIEVELLLQRRGKSLPDYPPVIEEFLYDRQEMHKEHKTLVEGLTSGQYIVYEKIMNSVQTECGGKYFGYGYGETGKKFVWRTLSAALRSKGDIVLYVASSGIASLLLLLLYFFLEGELHTRVNKFE
ncbi:unnamed protein product [Cuscuta europaea]|uniref:ATP-dependent DNA helicase n=1 Tax=Cuscuta europaea TaxID=41803 RepID=A0A9P0ZUI9_CUSEU|nr:unnamed protein product [Cuscuta europaea]